MRQVVVVCRSKKKKRREVASILDTYLWRIGDRTWRGRASNQCLTRISTELRKKASRHMAVAVYEIKRNIKSLKPIIVVGRSAAFSKEGIVPVKLKKRKYFLHENKEDQAFVDLMTVAAAFHDLGKATNMFQKKLRISKEEKRGLADPVRHEIISALIFDNLHQKSQTGFLNKITPAEIDKAFIDVEDIAYKLYESFLCANGGSVNLKFGIDIEKPSFAQYILLTILSHHRLADMSNEQKSFLTTHHLSMLREEKVSKDDFKVAPGVPFWHDECFLQKVNVAIERLVLSSNVEMEKIPEPAIYARTAFMLADHFASMEKSKKDQNYNPDSPEKVHMANADKETGLWGDTLLEHTNGVVKAVQKTSVMLLREFSGFKGINFVDCPKEISMPQNSGSRFGWQYEAFSKTMKLVSEYEGGFFGCVLAGTGTGKTRAAPTIMASATFNDRIENRRSLRISLGLGLRVLARQSGLEYVNDLGFSPVDVATIVGGASLEDKKEDDFVEGIGSEDRLSGFETLFASRVFDDVERDDIEGLSFELDKGLPDILARLIESNDKNKKTFNVLLKTPVTCATIDQYMPAADAAKGGHTIQMLRVLSSDLILDEIDLYTPEDLTAISRLVFISGLAGRRVLILSATVPEHCATVLYQAYEDGWKKYAQRKNLSENVNLLVTGDEKESCCVGVSSQVSFSELFSQSKMQTINSLEKKAVLRMSTLIEPCDTYKSIADQIVETSELLSKNTENLRQHDVSVGLVRFTRIKHLQEVVKILGSNEYKTNEVRYIVLHSKMPALVRFSIEKMLKECLTRKSDKDEEKNVQKLLKKICGDGGFENIKRIVVLSSPVIETGNDVDFDWAIIDPVSLRSIVQTVGRVNRHRCHEVKSPNIAIFSVPLMVSLNNEKPMIANPGIETKQSCKTGVRSLVLKSEERNLNGGLVDLSGMKTIDARICLDDSILWNCYEKELFERFSCNFPQNRLFAESDAARLSSVFPDKRRFRRSDRMTYSLLPYLNKGDIEKWGYFFKGHFEEVVRTHETIVDNLDVFFCQSLDGVFRDFNVGNGFRKEGLVQVYESDVKGGEFILDPILGILS